MPRSTARRSPHTVAVAALSAVATALGVLTLGAAPAVAGTPKSPIGYPSFPADAPLQRSPASCSTSVTSVAPGVGTGDDDTAAFATAFATALANAPACYPSGPSGDPQAVVYVPQGTYEIADLDFPSNVRMEVDARAVLQEPANRPDEGTRMSVPLISWDNPRVGGAPISNVSVVGVGKGMTPAKRDAQATGGAALKPFAIATFFTMNLDPATTNSTNYAAGIDMQNVRDFLVSNVFAIQNDTLPSKGDLVAWPTSARTVLELHAPKTSPIGGPFVQPTDGTVSNMAVVNSPRGFGPTQVNAATNVDFEDIFSEGGSTLRIETDGSMPKGGGTDRGASVDGLTARNIVGLNCNRAVALSPHDQTNGSVHVTGVWAYSCWEGVTAQEDTKVPEEMRGSFSDAVIDDVRVLAGVSAQLPSTDMLWNWGQSSSAFYVDPEVDWNPEIDVVATSGTFSGVIAPTKSGP